jgi:hypothetical protein
MTPKKRNSKDFHTHTRENNITTISRSPPTMRHFSTVLTVAALLMLAAPMSADAEKLSVNRQNSHNGKRVMAKLHHLSGARNVLERRLQRLKTPEVDARTPEMKATQSEIARETAVIKAKIAEAESRNMAVQAATNVSDRNTRPGITSGVTQFFDAPHCSSASTFRVLETRFHDVCARTDMSFVRRNWYDLGRANQAYTKFCTSACAGSINDLLQHTEGYTCFQSDVLTELRLFSALCQNAPVPTNAPVGTKPNRCGAEVAVSGVFDGITSDCEIGSMLTDKTSCQGDARCQWDTDMQMCQEKITAELIAKECSDCYIKIVDVVSSDFNSVCAKKQNQFCLPKLFKFNEVLEAHNHSFSKAMFSEVCGDPVMVPCFRAMDVGYDNKDINEARNVYQGCIQYGVMSASACATNFQKVLQRIDTNNAFWSQLCTKNTTTGGNAAPSDYCYRVSQGATENYNGCPYTQAAMSSCDSTCASENGRFLEEAGCCAAYLDFAPSVKAAQFPVFANNAPLAPT